MKIYLAARYTRHQELQDYARDLEDLGHEVTSRWIKGNHQITDEQLLDDDGAAILRRQFVLEDWQDLLDADCCISFTEPPRSERTRGGRHVEFGIALATSMRCVVVGPLENLFHAMPAVEVYSSWPELIDTLEAETEAYA